MQPNSIVITGVGIVSPIGIGADEYFAALMEQKSGIRSLEDRTDGGAKPDDASRNGQFSGLWTGAPIVDFEPKQYVKPRKALKVMCREIQIAFAASQLAIDRASLSDSFPCDPDSDLGPDQVGTVFGSEMFYGPPDEMLDAFQASRDESGTFDGSRFGAAAMKQIVPLWMLKYLPNMPACHVGIAINAHGPNNSLVLGDVSGPAAMMEAASCIDRQIADAMVTGAVGTRINTTRLNYRSDLPIPEIKDSSGMPSRPHHQDSQGVVGGEAAVSFVIETMEMAASHNAKPMAKIEAITSRFIPSQSFQSDHRSTASSQEAGRGSSQAAEKAILDCLKESGRSKQQIGAVVSGASGDPAMDHAERKAIESTIGPDVPVVAPCAAIGHPGAAIGAVGIATAALMIDKQIIPPTRHDPQTATVNFLDQATPLKKGAVLCLCQTSEGSAIATLLGDASS